MSKKKSTKPGLNPSKKENLKAIRAKGKHNKLEDILAMDYDAFLVLLNKENQPQFESIVSYMRKQANQRLRRLKENPLTSASPSLYEYDSRTGERFEKQPFKSKEYKTALHEGKDKRKVTGYKIDNNALTHQYMQLRQFLLAKTSTVEGYQAYREARANEIGSEKLFRNEFTSEREMKKWISRENKYWEMYHKLYADYQGVFNQLTSKEVQKILEKTMNKFNYHMTKEEQVMESMRAFLDKANIDKNNGGLNASNIVNEYKDILNNKDKKELEKYVLANNPMKKYA